jgi:hypothetical protein
MSPPSVMSTSSGTSVALSRLGGRNINLFDVRQVNSAVLHIRDPQIWTRFGRHCTVVLSNVNPVWT